MATPVEKRRSPDMTASPATGGAMGRVRSAPLWIHAVGLAIVLLVVLAVTVPGHAYFSDEGAAILQERQLRAGDGWIYDYPFAAADPSGDLRPFVNGQESDTGVAPYAKHPLYVGVLAAADGLLGVTGLVLVAVAGSLSAALAAGLLGRRIDRRLAVPSLWVAGLASPLFFDAYLVLAHTLAAATAAFAVLIALMILDRRTSPLWLFFVLALTTGTTVLLRSEGLVLVPALVVGAIVVGAGDQEKRGRAIQVGLVAAASGAIAFLGERALITAIVGDSSEGSRIKTENWLAGRFTGFTQTWLAPTAQPMTSADRVTMLTPLVLALTAFRAKQTRNGMVLAAGFGVVALMLLPRLASGTATPIPGLAIAFPIGWAGLWMLRRRDFSSIAMRFAASAGLTMVIGVLLTQFSRGGGVEWGGRYFAVALAVVTPVLLRPWLDLNWSGSRTRTGAVAVVAVTLALGTIAVVTLRDGHMLHRDIAAGVEAAQAANPPPAGARGVVVVTQRLGPQIMWPIFGEYDWLAPARTNVDQAGSVLDSSGRTATALVDTRTEDREQVWPGWVVIDTRRVNGSLPIQSLIRP